MGETLKDKTASGLIWGGLSSGVQQLLNLAIGIFLARMLTAAEYGMVGVLTIFSLIAGSLQESGFTSALTNLKQATDRDYNAVFWFNVLASSGIYAILYFCAPLIAGFYRQPALTPLSRYLFLSFVISSFGIAHSAYLFRNLMVKQRTVSVLIAQAISGAVGVTLVYFGYSYWGLATQTLVYCTVTMICFWCFSRWRPSFHIDFGPIKGMYGFSIKVLLTNIFQNINNNFFSVILGRYYNDATVGQYNQANKWCSMGHSMVNGMIIGVAQPVMARVAEDVERQKRVFRRLLRFSAFISFPVMLGLAIVAEPLITVAITDRWLESARIMQVLCVWGAFVPVQSVYTQMLLSRGMSRQYMVGIIMIGVVQVGVALAMMRRGLFAMFIAYVGVNICWLAYWQAYARRELHLSAAEAISDIVPLFFLTAVVMGVTWWTTQSITACWLLLCVRVALGAALYAGATRIFYPSMQKESIAYLKKKF
ncbi:MAG: lipopolysaccharide biosynthesis protein [Muribaculaceae bacterium]|nr:lipopolysaccharide biosynthesis protein [Muribaculaceae bacterium]